MKKFIVLPLVLMLSSCAIPFVGNSSLPGDNELNEQVKPLLLSNGASELVEIKNLHKTNGYEQNPNTYTVDIEYDWAFKIGWADLAKQTKPTIDALVKQGTPTASTAPSLEDTAGAAAGIGAGIGIGVLGLAYGEFKAGDSYNTKDSVTFIKTENGWRLSSKPKTVP
ncbi:hypothetical protein [Chamaesiphon polymorphus]|uniref:Lipoprotein n=1 Tax=Chamaesiphon polymorphus CCALA 037 TaxID=2107692 RepID=A0A2T1GIA9_9CYAN|nr:hypothetical protein [Chamaesiphon polymorphus]PSB57452.1 hypothetical protein C7B77_08330 [Chamaesiphon polymorphus CCALA 037]